MAISAAPRMLLACAASSAARAGSGCLRLTPRITFQPLAWASCFNRVRSAGVSVVTAQDGAFSPLAVQNVVSTKLPPKRITPGPSVFRYWARLPLVSAGEARMLASKDRPMKSSRRVGPEPLCTVIVLVAAWADPVAPVAAAPARASTNGGTSQRVFGRRNPLTSVRRTGGQVAGDWPVHRSASTGVRVRSRIHRRSVREAEASEPAPSAEDHRSEERRVG